MKMPEWVDRRLDKIDEKIKDFLLKAALNEDWADFPPAEKVRIIEAMGFTPMGMDHNADCPAVMDPGYNCICVPGPTEWSPPMDVMKHRNETYEERLEKARRREQR